MIEQSCRQCKAPAVIEDLEDDPVVPWCLICAMALLRIGDPVVNYRELDGGVMYTLALAERGSIETLKFR